MKEEEKRSGRGKEEGEKKGMKRGMCGEEEWRKEGKEERKGGKEERKRGKEEMNTHSPAVHHTIVPLDGYLCCQPA